MKISVSTHELCKVNFCGGLTHKCGVRDSVSVQIVRNIIILHSKICKVMHEMT